MVSKRSINRFLTLLILVVMGLLWLGCSTENVVSTDTQMEKTGDVIENVYWDESHTIRIIIHRNQFSAAQHHSGAVVKVANEEVCIGGGANAYGRYLTESRPLDDLSGWSAGAKDHIIKNSQPLDVYAIGLTLYKYEGWQMDRNELLQYIKLYTQTSDYAQHPSQAVSIPEGMNLIGGGAKVNWGGMGNLLVKSYPLNANTWYAESKDHKYTSYASMTTYAIGVNPHIIDFGTLLFETQTKYNNGSTCCFQEAGFYFDEPYLLACIGANATYEKYGMMLSELRIDTQWDKVFTKSRECVLGDRGALTAYGILIKKLM